MRVSVPNPIDGKTLRSWQEGGWPQRQKLLALCSVAGITKEDMKELPAKFVKIVASKHACSDLEELLKATKTGGLFKMPFWKTLTRYDEEAVRDVFKKCRGFYWLYYHAISAAKQVTCDLLHIYDYDDKFMRVRISTPAEDLPEFQTSQQMKYPVIQEVPCEPECMTYEGIIALVSNKWYFMLTSETRHEIIQMITDNANDFLNTKGTLNGVMIARTEGDSVPSAARFLIERIKGNYKDNLKIKGELLKGVKNFYIPPKDGSLCDNSHEELYNRIETSITNRISDQEYTLKAKR